MRRSIGWLTVAACVLMAASAYSIPPRSAVEAKWLSQASEADFSAAIERLKPTQAEFWRAAMRCAVADDGAIKNCSLVADAPSGAGYGAVLLSLSDKYRRQPPKADDMREIILVRTGRTWAKPGALFKAGDWLRKPSPEDYLGVWPKAALARGTGGRASIDCVATVQGALRDCLVVDEFPASSGFGNAAITLAPQLTMNPATVDGQAVPSQVRIPFAWAGSGTLLGAPIGSRRVAPDNMAWAAAPSFDDVRAAYPAKARVLRVAGRVSLSCVLTELGRLNRCEIASSSAKGMGFEGAAKDLAKLFRFPINSAEEAKLAKSFDVHLAVTFDPTLLDGGEATAGKPAWVSIPKTQDLVSAFGDTKLTGTGRVQLRCLVREGGYVESCEVAREEPTSAGLGAAALKLAPLFRLTAWSIEGLPVTGGHVVIPIRYEPTVSAVQPRPSQ